MKLLTQLFDRNNLDRLSEYADGFILGNDQFGTRLAHSFSLEELTLLISLIKSKGKQVFLMCNQLFTDDQLERLEPFLSQCPQSSLDGIIIGDIGALAILDRLNMKHLAVYHPETLLTHVHDFNFFSEEGLLGAFVAKEITLDAILAIGMNKSYKLFMMGHGHLNMFYSKRHLIDNFARYVHLDGHFESRQDLRIIEEMRPNEAYPILEDHAGTHVFRSSVMASIKHMEPLKKTVDYMVIDSLFKDDLYAYKMLFMYQNGYDIALQTWAEETYKERWDEGFLFTPTIYKQKKE